MKNIYSKERFTQVLGEIERSHTASSMLRAALSSWSEGTGNESVTDFFDPFCLYSGHEAALVDALSTMFMDCENRWIEYWLYELDFGRSYVPGMVKDSDGNETPLATASDLYDLLVSDMES